MGSLLFTIPVSRLRSLAAPACLAAVLLACSDMDEAPRNDPAPAPTAVSREASPAADVVLPPIDTVVDRLQRERWRIETPERLDAARKQFDVPPSPFLRRDEAAEKSIRAAIGELTLAIERAPAIADTLGPTLARSRSIAILLDDEPDALLRYDILHDALKVPRCALAYPRPLLAVAVAHELAHAGDHVEIARRLGLDREAEALLLDVVGVEAFERERTLLEERACRIELHVARALGIEIRPPTRPPRRVPGCLMTHEHLLHALAAFEAAEAGPPGTWARMLEAGPGAALTQP